MKSFRPRAPSSDRILSLCGLVLMGIGAYFAFARPSLLPEDVRYVGPALLQMENSAPQLGVLF